ncbi:GNAT family N-acetyltransferase [Streptomyces sp. N2-109]|uniref:GNAT family N-acetyltransferase n=1 Tax=Streptomyces gossypii TaxID=2883101 RepID=A0ABT2JVK8_9ACTN|nr:GNAT family N-acetyltransferase [Streptomyces gossypii]MCT2591930.1 GNAT family N-acetyltransferase [Streptomyces gossypii]
MEFTISGQLEVRISPDDVGKRVSVRSLTGPDEPSATFTDTVGVLTSWTDGVLKITRRDGTGVSLQESAVVAGKTVPPPPDRRRGVPAAAVPELQEVAARGWPALETERLGEWTLRASPVTPHGADPVADQPREGFTARGNSVLPLGSCGLDWETALREIVRWYAARGLPAKIQVTTEAGGGRPGATRTDERLAAALADRGWTAERHAQMRTGALAPLADREPDARVLLHRELSPEWLSLYGRASDDSHSTAARVLSGGPSVWFATVPRTGPEAAEADGPPAAIGRCVVDGRWAGFAAIEVAPDQRRQGLAEAVMAELARHALAEGASAGYLQVEPDNTAATALYDGLGFTVHHLYHYRRAPRE